jgi:hypothetical protein
MIFRSGSASAHSAHAPQTRNRPESAPARFNPRPGRMLDRRARIEARLRRTLIVAGGLRLMTPFATAIALVAAAGSPRAQPPSFLST